MTVKTQIKREINKVTVVGTLVEKNLKEKLFTNSNGETVEKIVGTISVRTVENEVHQIQIHFKKYNKASKRNGLSKEFILINEMVSLLDTINEPGLVADFIIVNGKLTQGENQQLKINGLHFDRIKLNADYSPSATFDLNVNILRVLEDLSSEGYINVKAMMLNNINNFSCTFKLPQESSVFFEEFDVRNKNMRLGGKILCNFKNNEYHPKLYVNSGCFI